MLCFRRLLRVPWTARRSNQSILKEINSEESSSEPWFKGINFLVHSIFDCPALTSVHDYWKNHSFDYTDLCWQSDVFAFNMLSRFVIAFPSRRSKHLLSSWLQSPSTVILEPKKIKSVTTFTFSPSIRQEVMGPDVTIFVFWMLKSQPFHSPLAPSSRGSLVPHCFLTLEWYCFIIR